MDGEAPEACLRRELREELGWEVGELERAVELVDGAGGGIAWFFRGRAPGEGEFEVRVAGAEEVWVEERELGRADLSAWHRAAIEAERRGEGRAVVG